MNSLAARFGIRSGAPVSARWGTSGNGAITGREVIVHFPPMFPLAGVPLPTFVPLAASLVVIARVVVVVVVGGAAVAMTPMWVLRLGLPVAGRRRMRSVRGRLA